MEIKNDFDQLRTHKDKTKKIIVNTKLLIFVKINKIASINYESIVLNHIRIILEQKNMLKKYG